VREVWVSTGPDTERANHFVDITETFSRKIAALKAHESQTGQREGLEDFLRTRLAHMAEQAGLPAGHLAESFQVLDTG
jgi:LmbE family N-acetylglucosaminyl deacetylase